MLYIWFQEKDVCVCFQSLLLPKSKAVKTGSIICTSGKKRAFKVEAKLSSELESVSGKKKGAHLADVAQTHKRFLVLVVLIYFSTAVTCCQENTG